MTVNTQPRLMKLLVIVVRHGRIDEEGAGHEGANRERHEHPRGGPEEWQTKGGQASWVRDAEGRERIRKEEEGNNSPHKARKNDKRKMQKAGRSCSRGYCRARLNRLLQGL